MKRFAAVGLISAITLTACNLLSDEENELCRVNFRFAQPVETVTTRTIDVPDTNSFILSIINVSGDTLWCGRYDKRPADFSIPGGTYNISVMSGNFDEPAFEKPCFGDRVTVIASNGQDIDIQFLCKLVNCGVKINMSDAFVEKYGNGGITVSQDIGHLTYSTSEERYGFFNSGNAAFMTGNELLFNKVFEEGKLFVLNISASKENSDTKFSISVASDMEPVCEDIIVGINYNGENGLSAATAFGTESAKNHIGDTVWVWGHIVGCYNKTSASSLTFSEPFESKSNIAISFMKKPSSNSQCMSVSLSTDKLKTALSLPDNPTNLGKKVFLRGVIEESYLGTVGIKKILEYKLEE